MQTRRLGRLGHESTVLAYGGAALYDVSEDAADASIAAALEAGINHFDTAAGYGDSELHLGRWMSRIRDRIFLATKTGDRTARGAYDSIRRSLERLRTDRVDLLQLHAVCTIEELDAVTTAGGAVEGVERAMGEGMVGAIGVTGHGMGAPAVHAEALRRYPFATVITPWNWQLDRVPQYRRNFRALVEEVGRQDAGLLVIKSCARGLWPESGPHTHTTWYEPLTEPRHIGAAVAFVLDRRAITAICTPGDVKLLPMVIEAERQREMWTSADIDAELGAVPDLDPPFLRKTGHAMPDWLAPLVPGSTA